jgi:triosephosphate isomerase
LCGHSERRHTFGENDKTVGRKVARALEAGLTPVLCVGEKIEEREEGKTMEVVSRQLAAGLQEVSDASLLAGIVVAYEPVWAIGTGRTATPAQGQEVHQFLRSELRKWLPDQRAENIRILYGGSVKPENAQELLAEKDIDGFLVGGASLRTDSFLKICQAGGSGHP